MSLRFIINKLFFEESWACAYRIIDKAEQDGLTSDSVKTSFTLISTKQRYWCADPFLIEDNGKTYLFCEMFDRHKSKGLLGICELIGNKTTEIKLIMELNCHTSYPCVFSYKNNWYMIPETLENRNIELFRAESFPNKWTLDKNILDKYEAVDTTVFEYEGEIYLFIYNLGYNNSNRTLSICKLDMEEKKIKELKTVVTYLEKVGRPAGNIISIKDKLIRPTQYCENIYGEKIIYKEISFYNDKYLEKDYDSLSPDSIQTDKKIKVLGVHTINRCGNYEVVDLYYKRFYPFRPIEVALKKFMVNFKTK